jgi:hypothetical protein
MYQAFKDDNVDNVGDGILLVYYNKNQAINKRNVCKQCRKDIQKMALNMVNLKSLEVYDTYLKAIRFFDDKEDFKDEEEWMGYQDRP